MTNWEPMNLPPGAVKLMRQVQNEIDTLKRIASRVDQEGGNTDRSNASTMQSLSQQIATIEAQQATLAAQQATLSSQQTTLSNQQTTITNQQNYLLALQPVSAATNTGNTQVAPGAYGTVRPSVTFNTQSGGQIEIEVSAMLYPLGGGMYGTYSISGATTVTRASKVAGNELFNNLFVQGATAIGATRSWIVNVAASASITVTAEFYADAGNSGNAAYAYPSLIVRNVS